MPYAFDFGKVAAVLGYVYFRKRHFRAVLPCCVAPKFLAVVPWFLFPLGPLMSSTSTWRGSLWCSMFLRIYLLGFILPESECMNVCVIASKILWGNEPSSLLY